jgi:hypothetical protein
LRRARMPGVPDSSHFPEECENPAMPEAVAANRESAIAGAETASETDKSGSPSPSIDKAENPAEVETKCENPAKPEAVAVTRSADESANREAAIAGTETAPETGKSGTPSDGVEEAKSPAETKDKEARDAETDKGSSEKNLLLKVAEASKAFFTVVSTLFLSALLVTLLISLIRDLTHSTVILDLLEVPKDFKDHGVTASAFSGELSDRISAIQKVPQRKNTRRLTEPSWEQPDIQVPGSNISFRTVSQWLKQKIDLPGVAADKAHPVVPG